jgi:uncharacterized membrane protein
VLERAALAVTQYVEPRRRPARRRLAGPVLREDLPVAVANHLHGDYVSVYVPTTPNPTSGFFLMIPRADVIELDMSVDEALKYVISMGVVSPHLPDARKP